VLILVAAAFITTVTNKLLYYFAAFTNPFERHASLKSWRKLVILFPSDCNHKSDTASGKALLLGFSNESLRSFCFINQQGAGMCPKACHTALSLCLLTTFSSLFVDPECAVL